MSKLQPEEQVTSTTRFNVCKSPLEQDAGTRNLLYQIRRSFYDGKVLPNVENGHDLVYTQYATIIVDRFASYCAANGLSIKVKPWNTGDQESLLAAEKVNEIIDKLYNSNYDFQYQIYLLHQTSGWAGDGYLDTTIKKGVPVHKSMNQPENIYLGFVDGNFDEFNYWIMEHPLSVDTIKLMYDVEVGEYPNFYSGTSIGSNIGTHNNPYASIIGTQLKDMAPTGPTINRGMAKYSVLHDFIKNERIQLFNEFAYFKDGDPKYIYPFRANIDSGRPGGLSDFETVAQIITKIDEKLSELSDAVSMSVHHKILTDLPTQRIKEAWKPNRTQAIKVNGGPNGNRFEILNTTTNQVDARALLDILLNALRTGSGLQELGQDQVSANVSGRAIAYMFQGVTEKVTTKRIQLNRVLDQMVKDDLEILAKSDSSIRKLIYDENGSFRFSVKIKYPPVLEQEEQVRISNLSTMKQTGLISGYSARLHLTDYIDDPVEEEKKIEEEKKKEVAQAQQLEAMANKAQQTAPVQPGGMEPVASNEGVGVPSTQGNQGTAQSGMSAKGMQNQLIQQTTAK